MPSLTPVQQNRLAMAYAQDAQTRGLDDKAQVRELLQFIFLPRPQQLTQLQNLVSRVRSGVSDLQANFDTNKASELAGINQVGSNLDDLSATIPTIT